MSLPHCIRWLINGRRLPHLTTLFIRAELERKVQDEQAMIAAQRMAEEEAKANSVEANKGRVELRHAEYKLKVQRMQEQQKALQALEMEKQERLDRLRALVAPVVEDDPQRVLKPTVASAAATAAIEEEKEAMQKGVSGAAFRPVHGYTVHQLYKDPRFKVISVHIIN